MWQSWYSRGQDMAPRLEQAAETATARAQEPAPERAPSTQPTQELETERPPQGRYRISPE
jgi:hypothetical protein